MFDRQASIKPQADNKWYFLLFFSEDWAFSSFKLCPKYSFENSYWNFIQIVYQALLSGKKNSNKKHFLKCHLQIVNG